MLPVRLALLLGEDLGGRASDLVDEHVDLHVLGEHFVLLLRSVDRLRVPVSCRRDCSPIGSSAELKEGSGVHRLADPTRPRPHPVLPWCGALFCVPGPSCSPAQRCPASWVRRLSRRQLRMSRSHGSNSRARAAMRSPLWQGRRCCAGPTAWIPRTGVAVWCSVWGRPQTDGGRAKPDAGGGSASCALWSGPVRRSGP